MEAVGMKFKTTLVKESKLPGVDLSNVPFGRVFSDHMFVAELKEGQWTSPEILPFGKIQISPSMTALHYGQSIFEGMKAFKMDDGQIALFRPEDNFKRMNRSAAGLEMAPIPHEIFMDGLKELVKIDKNWVPGFEGSSLYIRPVYFANDEYIGIKNADNFKFIIFTSPVGAYYPEPVKLWVTPDYVRAFEGGTGEYKAAGNYAGSLKAASIAREKGYHNVLWLDGKEHKYIEECGTMNIFFVIGKTVITPSLTGTILRGITRESCITILKDAGYNVEERKISFDEIVNAYRSGELRECFGTGTAATVAPVSTIGFEETVLNLPPISERKIGNFLLDKLNMIRKGTTEDKYSWMVRL